jgi:integrase
MRGDGRIYRRKNSASWWVAYYHRGQHIRESAHTADEEKARKFLRKKAKKANTAEFVNPAVERLTVADLADLVLTDYRLNERRSLSDVARHVRQLKIAFDGERALDLTSDRIAAYAAHRRFEGYAPASVNQELQVIRRMFTLAIQAGKLTPAHRPHIARLAVENAREGFLEPAPFVTLRAALPEWLADAAAFAYLTGWRKGEIATLTWADVTLRADDGTIRLRAAHSKNKKGRLVPLTGELLALLQHRRALRRLDCPLVFHRGAGEPLGNFRKVWASSCAAAQVPGLLFHDLRRSAVRNMVRAGVPERVAMALSGHQTRSVFDRYNIVSEEDLAAATARTADYVAEQEIKPATVVALVGGAPGERTRTVRAQSSGFRGD